MQCTVILEGGRIRVTATFLDIDGILADPDNVTFSVRDPEGTLATYTYPSSEVAKISTGVYALTLVPTLPGSYGVRVDGTSAVGVQAACETTFEVLAGDVL